MLKTAKAFMALLAMTFATFALTGASPAQAADVTIKLNNQTGSTLNYNFWTEDRNYVWPSGGRVYYNLPWSETQTTLSCTYGEKICYGAWREEDTSSYWGIGYQGRQGCETCCITCDGDTWSFTQTP